MIPDESLNLQGGVKSKESKHMGGSRLISSAHYNNNNVLRALMYTIQSRIDQDGAGGGGINGIF